MTDTSATAFFRTAAEEPTYYHGTRYPFKPGDHITPGRKSNQGYGQPNDRVFFTHRHDIAKIFAESADDPEGHEDARPRIFEVKPTGPHEMDTDELPEDAKASGSRQSRHPLQVVREVPYGHPHGEHHDEDDDHFDASEFEEDGCEECGKPMGEESWCGNCGYGHHTACCEEAGPQRHASLTATAFFRQASVSAKDLDYHTARHYLAETAFAKNHEHRTYGHISEAQDHAERIARYEGVPAPRIVQRIGNGSTYWHDGRRGGSGPEIALGGDHMHEAALIHEMTHHIRHTNGQPEGHGPDFSRDYGLALWDHHSRPDAARKEFKHYYDAAGELMRANPDHYPAPPEEDHDQQDGRTAARGDRPGRAAGDPAAHPDRAPAAPGQPERTAAGLRRQAAAEVERHPELQADLDRLGGGARHVQDTITALQHGHGGVTTYPLSHPLDGWHAAITSGGHQVVHRHDPDTKTLHVGYAGHNVTDAEERLGGSGGGEGSALPVEFHRGAEKDFDGLHPDVQDKVLDTIDRLSRREPHPHDHSLTGPLKGWGAARADFLNRVTHRYEDEHGNPTSTGKAARLFIGHVGPHNYEDAIKRLSSLTSFFREAAVQQTASVDETDDYRMQHRAPGPQHAPLHDPTRPNGDGGAFRQEGLDNPDWGEIGDPHEESLTAVRRAKGNPEAPVTIYRSVPHGVTSIRTGDWVSTSSRYALEHGMHPDDPSKDWPVLKATVPAKHVHTDGNDINEWGYNGPHIENAAVHGPDEEWTEPTHHTAARQPYSEDLADDRPVTFGYYRRTTPAPTNTVHYHGQDIEPHGRYVSQGKPYVDLPDLESGSLTFQRPLRLHSPTDDAGHPDHWKQQLVRRYDGKTGAELSQAIRDDGYDGIMTHDEFGPSETVDLTHLTPRTSALTMTAAEEELIRRQAAAVDRGDGVMVALVPPREVAEQLAMTGGQPVDDLHITLAYLGNASDYTREQLKLLPQVVGAWAVRHKPVTVRIGGVGKFNNPYKGQHVLWAAPDIPGGAQMHADLARYLEGHGYRLPSEHGWTPHMTLAYVDKHFRFMPHLEQHTWEAPEVVVFVRGQRHPARFGGRPASPTTL